MEYIDRNISTLDERIINWCINNADTYDALIEKKIFGTDIKDYIIKNNCEDMPIEWVVKLLL